MWILGWVLFGSFLGIKAYTFFLRKKEAETRWDTAGRDEVPLMEREEEWIDDGYDEAYESDDEPGELYEENGYDDWFEAEPEADAWEDTFQDEREETWRADGDEDRW